MRPPIFSGLLAPSPMVVTTVISEASLPALLQVTRLTVSYPGSSGRITAVRGISFSLGAGEIMALVGETGCGKSTVALALVGCLPGEATIDAEEIRIQGKPVPASNRDTAWRSIRGSQVGMVFQEPRSSLNPVLTVAGQFVDAICAHQRISRAEAKTRARQLLDRLGVRDPAFQLRRFPFELSGGMCQRVALGLAICNQPALVIADEPTSSLDPTIQRQVLDLLEEMNRDQHVTLLLISHDLALVAEYADRIAVMYNGFIVESGSAAEVTGSARHPYTRGLLAAMPGLGPQRRPLEAIPGSPPPRGAEFPGCPFEPRCGIADARCAAAYPAATLFGSGHYAACFKAESI